MAKPRTSTRPTQLSYSFTIIDDTAPDLRDAYHWFLRISWPAALGLIVGVYLLLNALFALAYLAAGGLANSQEGSFLDAFFFSAQTLGTIGYGAIHPVTPLANVLVVVESVVGLLFTAIATGLVFVRFSRVAGRMRFCKQVAVSPLNGVPHVVVRIGNSRSNRIFDAQMRLTLVRTQKTQEGGVIYKNEDLQLVRSWAPNLMRSWNLLHKIEPGSPLHGLSPKDLLACDGELQVAVTGTDETTLQPVHGRHIWEAPDIIYGARLADVIRESSEGDIVADMRRFDELVPTVATEGFPYPPPAT